MIFSDQVTRGIPTLIKQSGNNKKFVGLPLTFTYINFKQHHMICICFHTTQVLFFCKRGCFVTSDINVTSVQCHSLSAYSNDSKMGEHRVLEYLHVLGGRG